MQISLSTWMAIFFIFALAISIWKVYAFLPTKALPDDDTTPEATEALISCMLEVIQEHKGELTEKALFQAMIEQQAFDKKRFWRFNQNRLKHLLEHYYLEHKNIQNIKDIYTALV